MTRFDLTTVHKLQAALMEARGDRSRAAIADAAIKIPGSHPDFSLQDVERHEFRIRKVPSCGWKFRTHLAAVGISLPDALAMIGSGYWPPLGTASESVRQELEAFCKARGARIAQYDPESKRVVIQLG